MDSKHLGLKLIFLWVINMSHHHDVINKHFNRHGRNSLSVDFEGQNNGINIKPLPSVYLCNCLSIFFYGFLYEVSDSQEIAICLKKHSVDYKLLVGQNCSFFRSICSRQYFRSIFLSFISFISWLVTWLANNLNLPIVLCRVFLKYDLLWSCDSSFESS